MTAGPVTSSQEVYNSRPAMRSGRDAAVPDGMTADKLRYVADSLDVMQRLLLNLAPQLRINGEVPDGAGMATFTDWLAGTEQQDDLRVWADALDATAETT